MNCLNGYFLAPGYNSIAEAFLKAEGRGSIAGFSSITMGMLIVSETMYRDPAALLDLEQTDVGEAALQECLWLRPDFPEAKYAQALVFLQKGDRARAMSQLREVVALNPRHPYANKTLAQLCAEEGDMVGSAACLSAHAQVYGTAQ